MIAIFCAHYLKFCVNMVDFIFKKVSTVAQVKQRKSLVVDFVFVVYKF